MAENFFKKFSKKGGEVSPPFVTRESLNPDNFFGKMQRDNATIKNIVDAIYKISARGEVFIANKDDIKGDKGDKGDAGDAGKKGEAGTNGKDGRSIEKALMQGDMLYLRYSDGKTEKVGRIVGRDGINGTNGKDGINGKDGKNGKDGIDGRSITNASINKNGELLLEFSDGFQENVGKVRGEDGRHIVAGGGTNIGVGVMNAGALIGTGISLIDFTGSAITSISRVDRKVTIDIAGGSATWGSITGTLSSQTDLQTALDGKVDENAPITGATKTKITYDAKGLVTTGADATTADISESGGNLYFTDERAQDAVGAMVDSTLVYTDATPLLSRAALTGDITAAAGSNATTLATVNSNVGSFGSSTEIPVMTVNGKGLVTGVSTASVSIPSGSATTRSIAQASHGFAVGEIVRLNGTSYTKAQADAAANAEAAGMVSAVVDANNFTLTTGGYVSGLSGLTAGEIYFLSTATPGAMTTTDPTVAGAADTVSKPVFYADSTTSGYFTNMRGQIINPSSGSGTNPPLSFQVMPAQLPTGISTPGVTTITGGTSGERITAYGFDQTTEEFLDVPVVVNNYVSGDIKVNLPVVSSPVAAAGVPTYQSTQQALNTITVSKPTSTASGDLLILHVRTYFNDTITPPSGFTQIGSTTGRQSVFWKVAGGSEPSTYSIGNTLTANICILEMTRITGAHATTPINASGSTNNSMVAPSVTTTSDNCLIMCFAATGGTVGITTPGTLTSRYAIQNYVDDGEGGTLYTNANMGTKSQNALGASGTFTFTTGDVGGLGYSSFTIAIAPGVAADPSYTGNTTLKVSPRVVSTDMSVTFNYATNAVTAVKAIGLGCNVEEITIPAASVSGLASFKMMNLRISRTSASNTLTGDLHFLPQLLSVSQ